jgi:hypothetical protein
VGSRGEGGAKPSGTYEILLKEDILRFKIINRGWNLSETTFHSGRNIESQIQMQKLSSDKKTSIQGHNLSILIYFLDTQLC